MTARTVLITFQDHKVADLFVKAMAGEVEDFAGSDYEHVLSKAEVDAMVARPSLACHCSPSRKRGGRGGAKLISNFKRVPKFGWFVCTECNRPTATVVNNFIENRIMGLVDLLGKVKPVHDVGTIEIVARQERRAS
jgi:hypothetical protein